MLPGASCCEFFVLSWNRKIPPGPRSSGALWVQKRERRKIWCVMTYSKLLRWEFSCARVFCALETRKTSWKSTFLGEMCPKCPEGENHHPGRRRVLRTMSKTHAAHTHSLMVCLWRVPVWQISGRWRWFSGTWWWISHFSQTLKIQFLRVLKIVWGQWGIIGDDSGMFWVEFSWIHPKMTPK